MSNEPISIKVQGQITCDFTILEITPAFVMVRDDCNNSFGRSVTNAAEQVVKYLLDRYPGRRFVYCDTEEQWDELVHNNHAFLRFAPLDAKAQQALDDM